jgi:HTH-type transcriptional regulator/antitoxin HigA
MPRTPFKIKVIRNTNDHEKALSRIDELMDAEPGEPGFDELEVLTALVEHYENAVEPIDMPSPIAAIEFRMEQAGLKPRDLIPMLGSRTAVSEVLSGKRPLTLTMAHALHEALGIPAALLLKPAQKSLGSLISSFAKFPLKAMYKLGWIAEASEKALQKLIKTLGPDVPEIQPMYRKNDTSRQNAQTDVYALQAWCLRVLKEALDQRIKVTYEKGTVDEAFLQDIAKLSIHENGPLLAKAELAKKGIALVALQHLPRTHLDGAAFWFKDRPVIGMTLRYDRVDNFWFCLLHELAHIGRHLDGEPKTSFVDDHSLRGTSKDPREHEADDWAEKALIPKPEWEASAAKSNQTPEAVMALARLVHRHPAIIAGRIRYEGKNYHLLSQFVGSGTIRKQFWGTDKKTAA